MPGANAKRLPRRWGRHDESGGSRRPSMDDLRIQIVNYKTKKYLLDCLRSLVADLAPDNLRYSIGILDNASGDDLSDIPFLFPGQPIEIVASNENIGFGAGHNLLASGANARFLLLLNPDTKIVEPKTVSRMMESAGQFSAQIIGPRLVTLHGSTQRWDHGELEGLCARIAARWGKSYWKKMVRALRVAWVSGAVFLIEKSWFDRMGGFDEKFFLYKEEEDLCLRTRQAGGVIIYNPTITVFHYGSVVAKKSEHIKKSSEYFAEKHRRHKI